jgi:hypothetical protein
MVKIENLNELERIKKENFGLVVIIDDQSNAVLHLPNCKMITNEEYLHSKKKFDISRFFWFSTFSLAEREFKIIISCKSCNP